MTTRGQLAEVLLGLMGGLLAFVISAYALIGAYSLAKTDPPDAAKVAEYFFQITQRCGGTVVPSTLLHNRPDGYRYQKVVTYTPLRNDPACVPVAASTDDEW